jgi:processing peptidase subunit beta
MLPSSRSLLRSSASLRPYSSGATQAQALQASSGGTRVSVLPSGLKIATETTPHLTATVALYIDAGSRFETAQTNGTAHFLEHLSFKGTTNRSQQALESEVENMGAHLNAYTSREQTVYYAKCFAKDVPRGTDILADIIQNSVLDPGAIERERDVIIREMKEVENMPEEVVFDYLHATAYQGTALARTILGPESNIRSIQQSDLKQYIADNYTADRIVLAAAGGIDHDEMVDLASRLFSDLPSGSGPPPTSPARFTGSEVRARDDTMDLAHIALAVEGVGWTHDDFFPLMVANSIVGSYDRSFGGGGSLSSGLAQTCNQHGLAHSYMSFHTSYDDTGLWGWYGVCESDKVEDLVWAVQQEWVRICQGATEAEVERAKQQLKASMIFQVDGTTALCEEIGRHMLTYRQRYTPEMICEMIDSVSAANVREVGKQYIYDQCPAVAGVGPIEQLMDYNRIRSGMYWLRA